MYDTALINIIRKPEAIEVYVEIITKKKIKSSVAKTFILNESYHDKLLFDYIQQFAADTPYFYIATLDISNEQGALPTCNKQELPHFKELSTSQYFCVDNLWTCYSSKIDLQAQIDFMDDAGLDFIFSPFVLLKDFFKDKIISNIALYVLLLENAIVLAVFEESKLLYGDYIDMNLSIENTSDIESLENEQMETDTIDLDESVNLDQIDLENDINFDDDMEDMDNFDSIEDLDSIEELATEDLEQKLEENYEEASSEKINELEKEEMQEEKMTQDFQRFSLIQNSLAIYYKDSRYKSDFIENIYIADSVRVSNDFKKYIQDELFLNVYMRSIEVEIELCNLTKAELGFENV